MLKKTIIFLLLLNQVLFAREKQEEDKIVTATKQIAFKEFPGAHNPSIIKWNQGFLLIFRYCPDLATEPTLSLIGAVVLNDSFEPISEPQILNTRAKGSKTPSQSEDARLFSFRDRTFLIYNDNIDVSAPGLSDRRDMFISELFYEGRRFSLSAPLKLIHEGKYSTVLWQKNWVPFEWNKTLMMIYSINPHEILYLNFINGSCYHCYDSWAPLNWKHGTLRGSTPPQLVDGEYLAFFHSGTVTKSAASWDLDLWHYFMGAYTFSAKPPFEITSMTPNPIVADGFYTPSPYFKRVIFPGGFVVSGSSLYVAYGKDDCEIWIATLDKAALKRALVPIEKTEE